MDAFAELGLERDLGVGEEAVRARFNALSAERHPDAGGSREGFARLREAHEVLRRPSSRLRHWLELGGRSSGGVSGVPEGVVERFGEVGALVQRVGALEAKRAGAQSALGRSLVERERMELTGELERLRGELGAECAALEARLPEFQERGVEDCGDEALELAASLAFLERWEGQLQEAWLRLAAWDA